MALSSRLGAWFVVVAVCSLSGSFLFAGSAQAAASTPNITGEWEVYSSQGTSDTINVTQTGPSTYTFANSEGFSVTDVNATVSSSGATVTTCWEGPSYPNSGCPSGGVGYFIVTYNFNLTNCPATLTGSYADYNADGSPGGTSGTYVPPSGQISGGPSCDHTVSGTVYQPDGTTGAGGVSVLVKGTANDGSAVSVTGMSAATTGAWSVTVPQGSYTAGPTLDGSTFAPAGLFDPETQPVTVDSQDVTGVNFTTTACSAGDESDLPHTRAATRGFASPRSSTCRPTAINMVCSFQPFVFVSFSKITDQSCFVTVRDGGKLPHQNPEGQWCSTRSV